MHGGAISLAQQFIASSFQPDLILATDMLDLTTFLSLSRKKSQNIPTAIYFHENQLTYPWSPDDRDVVHKRDQHYGFINYVSALTADKVLFNSHYHQESFLTEAGRFLKHFPDQQNLDSVAAIRQKSDVLPLGLNLSGLDNYAEQETKNTKLIIWNHRWEFDKNPGEFFQALFSLANKGLDFQIALLGENFSREPKEFVLARRILGDRVVRYGYAKSFEDYARWLWRATILPVTSIQDFFGISVAEAIYCGCYPLLPRRLSYPELVSADLHADHFYDDYDELTTKLEKLLTTGKPKVSPQLRQTISAYSWHKMLPSYDALFEQIIAD